MSTDPAGDGGPPPWVRLRFAKLGKVRFISHRDVARAWERAVRRVGLPVAWSQGFSPRPLISFGLALPTGCESVAEYLDIRLARPLDSGVPAAELDAALPEGLSVLGVARRGEDAGSLQQEVSSCCWELEVTGVSGEELVARVQRFRSSPSVPVTRVHKGREVSQDVRPAVRQLRIATPVTADGPPHQVTAELSTKPRGVRPKELVAGFGAGPVLARARRTEQWIERDGTRREPLPIDGNLAAAGPTGVLTERTP